MPISHRIYVCPCGCEWVWEASKDTYADIIFVANNYLQHRHGLIDTCDHTTTRHHHEKLAHEDIQWATEQLRAA